MANKKTGPSRPGAPQSLKLAGMMYAQMQDEADARALADDALPQPPEDVLARTDSAVHAMLAAQHKTARRKRLAKRMLRTAAAAAVALCVAAPLALTVDATRAVAANFLIQNFDKFSTITYDINNNAGPPIGWTSEYYPQWLPEEYEFDQIVLEDSRTEIWYEDGSDYKVYFSIFSQGNAIDIDSENAYCLYQSVGAYESILYVKNDRRSATMVIFLPSVTLYLQGNLTETEILKIANSIHGIA